MIRILFILFLFISKSDFLTAQIEIMKHFDAGQYRVGFKHEIVTDYSRSYGNAFRPVQLFVWYPSDEKSERPLNYADYFLFDKKGQKCNESTIDSILLGEISSGNINIPGEIGTILANYKKLKAIAYEGIAVAKKSFPLILFAPGGNTSGHLHAALCEYLASHGNIVVSIPSLGNVDSLSWPFDQTGLNLQVEDMSLAINHMANSMKNLQVEKICLISWSVGGVSQAILCMKNPNIGMLISLDSGLGRAYGVGMFKESPYFNYNKIQIPYLHITGKQPEKYNVKRSTEFFDSIPSPEKYSLNIEPFTHENFTSQLGLIPALVSGQSDSDVATSYVKMSQITLGFINAFLKNETGAKQKWLDKIKEF